MDQLLSLLCACIKQTVMEDADNDGVPDFMQKGKLRQADSLDDALKRNLLSIRGRRKLVRNIPIEILPTKFEDDDDPPSIDEDGEEVSVFQHGVFAGQNYDNMKTK